MPRTIEDIKADYLALRDIINSPPDDNGTPEELRRRSLEALSAFSQFIDAGDELIAAGIDLKELEKDKDRSC